MSKQKKFVVDSSQSICVISDSTNLSLGIELELQQREKLIIGFLLLKDELIDTLVIKDQHSKEKVFIERHEKFNKDIVKERLRVRSNISKRDNNWNTLVTNNDVSRIIAWYLHSFIDTVYQKLVLDIECEEANILLFSTKPEILNAPCPCPDS